MNFVKMASPRHHATATPSTGPYESLRVCRDRVATASVPRRYMALLDEHITTTQAMSFSAFKGPFEERIDTWNETLNTVSYLCPENDSRLAIAAPRPCGP